MLIVNERSGVILNKYFKRRWYNIVPFFKGMTHCVKALGFKIR